MSLLASTLSTMINRILRLDPDIHSALRPLSGKIFQLDVIGLGLRLYFMPHSGGVDVSDVASKPPDTVIRATPIALMKMGYLQMVDSPKPFGDVDISGDVEAGYAFSRIISQFDIDWEELLAKQVGDRVANQIGRAVRGVHAWGCDARSKIQENMTEFLQEELRCLPPREEVDDFFTDVDDLRDQAERLMALWREIGSSDDDVIPAEAGI